MTQYVMTTKVFLKFCVISLLSLNSFLILCVNKNDSKDGQYYLSFHNGFNNNEVEIYFDGVFQVKTVLSTLPQVGVATSSESLPPVPKCTKVIALQVPELGISSDYSLIHNEKRIIGIWLYKEKKTFAFRQAEIFMNR